MNDFEIFKKNIQDDLIWLISRSLRTIKTSDLKELRDKARIERNIYTKILKDIESNKYLKYDNLEFSEE